MPKPNHMLAMIAIGLLALFVTILVVERIVIELRNRLRPERRELSPPHMPLTAEPEHANRT